MRKINSETIFSRPLHYAEEANGKQNIPISENEVAIVWEGSEHNRKHRTSI